MSENVFKRYMVFAWYDYEAYGGLDDCKKSFDKAENAIEFAESKKDFSVDCEIFDRVKGVKIEWK